MGQASRQERQGSAVLTQSQAGVDTFDEPWDKGQPVAGHQPGKWWQAHPPSQGELRDSGSHRQTWRCSALCPGGSRLLLPSSSGPGSDGGAAAAGAAPGAAGAAPGATADSSADGSGLPDSGSRSPGEGPEPRLWRRRPVHVPRAMVRVLVGSGPVPGDLG